MKNYEFSPLGDSGVIVKLGDVIVQRTHEIVVMFTDYLQENPFPGMMEIVPGFTTVAVYYDPIILAQQSLHELMPYESVLAILDQMFQELTVTRKAQPRLVEIPVCYGGSLGPDLDIVAQQNSLTREEVIAIHSSAGYLVYMIGFAPGFPYLGGMDERLATPRRSSPRLSIPKGSVGIGGSQTGIYSIETPGGWQIIGRTPLSLFQPNESQPSLLRAGDKVCFRPISEQEYEYEVGKKVFP
ncbi:5-oxoprolinase subunit PxpB [Brevibacillus fortis]|uniref:Kinase inhibitor n=1 Tax=Brevibacillus fortis TaxID=2126352 RepID=A0A2P7VK91_9BACL|nr:5-oxoprolinase subunit PxpB [Brevibacillus fortis]PSJ99631.1 kinase inhibitor [Brevibacillus fortis]